MIFYALIALFVEYVLPALIVVAFVVLIVSALVSLFKSRKGSAGDE